MLFDVTCRNKDGSRSEIEIDVADKADLWPELRRRGIDAISISDGRTASARRRTASRQPHLSARGIKWILPCSLAIAAVAVLCFRSSEMVRTKGETAGAEAAGSAAYASRQRESHKVDVRSADSCSDRAVKSNEVMQSQSDAASGLGAEKIDVVTNADEKAERPKRKIVFSNPMDQLMAMVMPMEPGQAVPPVPISDDMEFTPEQEQQMLERLTANEDDTDAVLERKELVQAMRDEYTELRTKHGWRFVDYIKALEAKARIDNEVLSESVAIHETVFNDPNVSDEEYMETLEKINKVLSERGIKGISIPVDEEGITTANSKEKSK